MKLVKTSKIISYAVLSVIAVSLLFLSGCNGASEEDINIETSSTIVKIQISPNDISIAQSTGQQFRATAIYDDNSHKEITDQVEWSVSDTSILSKNNSDGKKGFFTSNGLGTTQVSATLDNVDGSANITVNLATLRQLEISPINARVAVTNTQQFSVIGIYSDNSKQDLTSQVEWSTDDSTIASIDSLGLATSNNDGSTTVSATLNGISSETSITVTPAELVSIEISPDQNSIPLGTDQQYKASGIYYDNSTQDLTNQVVWSSSDINTATISNQGLVATVNAGSTTINATLNEITGNATLTITAATLERIEVTSAQTSIPKGTNVQLTATGFYSDNTTNDLTEQVTWQTTDSSIATISNLDGQEGLVTSSGVGTITSTAGFAGISGDTDLTVTAASLASIEVTPTNANVSAGGELQFTATGIYTDGSSVDITQQVTWTSSMTDIGTISNVEDQQGMVSTNNAGQTTITAHLGSVSGNSPLSVTAATIVSIEISPLGPSISNGNSQQFTATGSYSDGSGLDLTSQVTWEISNNNIASVDSLGLATSNSDGSTTISATLNGISSETSITVTPAELVSIEISPDQNSIPLGTDQQYKASGIYFDNSTQDLTNQVVWSSSDISTATISTQGLVATVSAGSTTINATLNDITGNATLTVAVATLVSIEISPPGPSISNGNSQQFTATGSYSDGSSLDLTSQVTWEISNNNIASVDSLGLATSNSDGSTTISATLNGISSETSITVTPAELVSIEISPDQNSIPLGTDQQYKASGIYFDNSTQDLTNQVVWSSSDISTATISTQGLVATVNAGSTTISAKLNDITGNAALSVTAATLERIEVTPTQTSIPKGTNVQLTATGFYSDNTTNDLTEQVTWQTTDSSIATISNLDGQEGLVTSSGVGTITATADFAGISGDTDLTVTAVNLIQIDVTPTNANVSGGELQFTATGIYTDGSSVDITQQVTWRSSMTDIGTISNVEDQQGMVSTNNAGQTTITAHLGSVSGNSPLIVTAATIVSIEISPLGPSISIGNSQQFTATGSYSDGSGLDLTSQVTWETNNNNIASIDSHGLATSNSDGSTTVSATLKGISSETSITVTPAELVSIEISPDQNSIPLGTDQQYKASGIYYDNSTQDLTNQVVWSSSDISTATISTQGLVATVSAGSTTISAKFNDIFGTMALTVVAAILERIEVTPAQTSIPNGTNVQLDAIGFYSDNTTKNLTEQVTWQTSDSSIADIRNSDGQEGLVTSSSVGVITATADFTGISGTTDLTVTEASLTHIEVGPTNANIAAGNELQFIATGIYTDGSSLDITRQVTWSSSMTNICTISNVADSQGVVTAVNAGQTTIVAQFETEALSGNSLLNVTEATLVSIEISPPGPSIPNGTSQQFVATGNYSDGSSLDLTTQVTWDVDENSIVSISNSGFADSTSAGATSISAKYNEVSAYSTLTVSDAVLVSIDINHDNDSIANGTKQSFAAVGHYSDGSSKDLTQEVTWGSSNNDVVTINNLGGSKGVASSHTMGSVNITAIFGSVSSNTNLTVSSAELLSITIYENSSELIKGTSMQLSASGYYSDSSIQDITNQVIWNSSDTSIASASNATGSHGLISGLMVGNINISATMDSVSDNVVLTITSDPNAPVSIVAYATPNAILNDGEDNTTLIATIQPAEPTGLIPDNTVVEFSITEGDQVTNETALTNNGSAEIILTSTYEGTIVVDVRVQGTDINNVAYVHSVSNFNQVLGMAISLEGNYENGVYLSGTKFGLLIGNYSNRTFNISQYQFANGDTVLMNITDPAALSDGELNGGEATQITVALSSDLTDNGVTVGYMLNDPATATPFGFRLLFRYE